MNTAAATKLDQVTAGEKAAQQAPTPAAPTELMFTVRDTTAQAGPRTHVMLDEKGREKPITFPDSYTRVPVPYRYALQFAKAEEFEVLDQNERPIRASKTERVSSVKLNSNEVIASLDELTQQALHARAVKAGGKFQPKASKADMCAFLESMAGLELAEETANLIAQETEGAGDAEIDDPY